MIRPLFYLLFVAACHPAALTTANPKTPPTGLVACSADAGCPSANHCAQFAGDAYCAPDCATQICGVGTTCIHANSQQGQAVAVCVPDADVPAMNGGSSSGAGGTSSGSTSGASSGGSTSGASSSGTTSGTSSGGSASSAGSGARPTGGTGVSPSGGTLDVLSFAIVGDTRPAIIEDTKGYPTEIISTIYQDIADAKPAFAIATGDYMYALPGGTTGAAQLDVYLTARKLYAGTVFYTMGNHECDGITFSNCGPGTISGVTTNFQAFQSKLLSEINQTNPYYRVRVDATNGSWSAKFLVIAANYWSDAQNTWLDTALAESTTYTFVVRHEGSDAINSGVTASDATMKKHPYTLLLAGHTHTFSYDAAGKQVITGIGGAPLTGSIDYGYVIAQQQADGTLTFTVYDYKTKAVIQTFTVKADGTPAP